MATALLSVPTPQQSPATLRPYTTNKSWLHAPMTSVKYPYKPFILVSSSSSSSVSVVEDGPSPPSPDDSAPVQSQSATSPTDNLPSRGCKACGRKEMERGCNGEGRIQGGIATVPGFGWWPIKAYRPCPGFLASGGRYRRQGQSMDEVAFGRGGRTPVSTTPVSTSSEVESSKKQGGRKLKR